jgi:4'-phosphopantetheinyl transferase
VRFFAPQEADALAAMADPGAGFTRLWCAKEAVIKAHGLGLAFGLERLVFAVDATGDWQLVETDPRLGRPADWTLAHFAPAPGYRACVAWRDDPVGQDPPPGGAAHAPPTMA